MILVGHENQEIKLAQRELLRFTVLCLSPTKDLQINLFGDTPSALFIDITNLSICKHAWRMSL